MKIGDILKLARKEKRMTCREVAEHIGVRPSSVSYFEQGEKTPTKEEAKKLGRLLLDSDSILLDFIPGDQPDPVSRLNDVLTEADQIIENHPELIEPIDKEQFKRIEKLVEGVETDDLPTRLRELAGEMRTVRKNLSNIGYHVERLGSLASALDVIANELEKEE